jgi:hypothetical protein
MSNEPVQTHQDPSVDVTGQGVQPSGLAPEVAAAAHPKASDALDKPTEDDDVLVTDTPMSTEAGPLEVHDRPDEKDSDVRPVKFAEK